MQGFQGYGENLDFLFSVQQEATRGFGTCKRHEQICNLKKMNLAAVWRIDKGARLKEGRPVMSSIDRMRDDVAVQTKKWRDWRHI